MASEGEKEIDSIAQRIILGTANFGSDYGLGPARDTESILHEAWALGVRCLDTAPAYGESMQILYKFLHENPDCPFNVISKFKSADDIGRSYLLFEDNLEAMLIHNFDGNLPELGYDLKIGATTYGPLNALLAKDMGLSPIQIEYNLLNRASLIDCDDLICRSVFMRGFLTDEPVNIRGFSNLKSTLTDLATSWNMTLQGMSLKYVLETTKGRVVIGIEKPNQLTQVLTDALGPINVDMIESIVNGVPPVDMRSVSFCAP